MDIFETHADITRDYRDYIHSFINIRRSRISLHPTPPHHPGAIS